MEDRENGEFRYETTFFDCAIIGNALQGTWTMEFETTVNGTIGGVGGDGDWIEHFFVHMVLAAHVRNCNDMSTHTLIDLYFE